MIEEPQREGLGPLGLSNHEKKREERDTKTREGENQENSLCFVSPFIWFTVRRKQHNRKTRQVVKRLVETPNLPPVMSLFGSELTVEGEGA